MMCKAQPHLVGGPPHAHVAPNAFAGVVELLPRWLAPNLITLAGTFGLVLAYLVSAYYVPSFSGEHHISPLTYVAALCTLHASAHLRLLLHATRACAPVGVPSERHGGPSVPPPGLY